MAHSIPLRSHASLALLAVVVAAGCKPPEPPDGLYIWCYGNGALYHIDQAGAPQDRISICLGDQFLNETGAGGTEGEINLAEWTNDTEDLDLMRLMCEEKCKTYAFGTNNCEPDAEHIWQIRNYHWQPTPDPLMLIKDPWVRFCDGPAAKLAPAPWETLVIPAGVSITWPGTNKYITLSCEDFATCATWFDAPISSFLYYDDTAETWDADMGFADYLVTTSIGSSQLEITLLNPEGAPSSDIYDVDGRIEYSAPDCGETECPFYLANLTLYNATDTWKLSAEKQGNGAGVYISDIAAQLRRPTLGVWNTSTNQVYLGKERMDIYVMVTHQIGTDQPVEGAYLVTNVDGIFGKIDSGEIQVLDLSVDDGSYIGFTANLIYDTIVGSPPTAVHGMGSTVPAPGPDGLPLSSVTDFSSDPDDDIVSKTWFVDEIERSISYIIPPGSNEIALRVIDERGATDIDGSTVEVLAP